MSMNSWIHPTQWDSKAQKRIGNSEEAQTLNCFLNVKINEVNKHINSLMLAGNHPTSETIINMLKGIGVRKRTLVEIYEYHNKEFQEEVKIGKRKKSRLEKHEINLKKIKSFLKTKHNSFDIDIERLDIDFIVDYEKYLRIQNKLAHNTVAGYCKALKAVANMAYHKKWLGRHPFEEWKVGFINTLRPFLTAEELSRLETQTFKMERLERIRDIFAFSCYTGLAFADIAELTPANIIRGIDGTEWLSINRKKTNTPINIPLLSPAKAIRDKYLLHPECEAKGILLPIKAHQTTNAYLKEIAVLCGIDKKFGFHAARHTFATTVTLANGVPLETVSNLLGHSDLKTTKIYAKIGDAKKKTEMDELDKKIEAYKKESSKSINPIDFYEFDHIIRSN